MQAWNSAHARADHAYVELALAQALQDAPKKPWTYSAAAWLSIFLLLLLVAYLGWMAGAGRLRG